MNISEIAVIFLGKKGNKMKVILTHVVAKEKKSPRRPPQLSTQSSDGHFSLLMSRMYQNGGRI